MVLFPNCKINIGLNILAKRSDGYHDLQTIFYPAAVKDAVEIIASDDSSTEIIFTGSGIPIHGTQENNLCVKAYRLLKKDYPHLPAVKMHLHKTIPMGAGLGGGSADAAFTLQLLNTKFSLGLSPQQLLPYALQLGSDCPFFIINKPCYASGRGEILEPLQLDLSAYALLIVNPGIHISTSLAFSNITIAANKKDLRQLIAKPIQEWKDTIINDFEKPVFEAWPQIAAIKTALYTSGAIYAGMSGSGSSVFGIFKKEDIPAINFPEHYFCRWL